MSTTNGRVYLWVSLPDVCDLSVYSPIPDTLNPLDLMVLRELGDDLLPGAYIKREIVLLEDFAEAAYFVIECSSDRAAAIKGGMEAIGKRKLGYPARTRTTERPPNGDAWEHIV
jgi:hypothetical protein